MMKFQGCGSSTLYNSNSPSLTCMYGSVCSKVKLEEQKCSFQNALLYQWIHSRMSRSDHD